MTEPTRRDFLKLARAGFLYMSAALSLGGLIRFLGFESHPAPKTEFEIGAADAYPLGSRVSISEIPALLIHAPEGFIALSLACTHLGCTLEARENGFACPCHGSAFDADGSVTHGPAVKPLRRLRVEVTPQNRVKIFALIEKFP